MSDEVNEEMIFLDMGFSCIFFILHVVESMWCKGHILLQTQVRVIARRVLILILAQVLVIILALFSLPLFPPQKLLSLKSLVYRHYAILFAFTSSLTRNKKV